MRTSKILAATDLSPCGDAAVGAAFDLASATNGEVHLLHVFEPATAKAGSEAATLIDDAEREAEHRLRSAAQLRVSSVYRGKVILRRGDPASLIVDTANELDADLLIVGIHDRRGLDRLRLGSVAERVVHAAHCSVLVVRDR